MKTAFVFPGQGSQYVGMAKDLVEMYPVARSVFDEADAVLRFRLSQLCFNGPENDLTDTINAQPALLTHSIAAWRVLQSLGGNITPAFVAGHSLGEYSALVVANVMRFSDALQLVHERGRVMRAAGDLHPGMMAAMIGIGETELEAICRETGAQIANYNAPGQIVISGAKEDMERAMALAKTRGARRIVPLAVSIASHSRLMEPAAHEFAPQVERTPMKTAAVPVISNVTAQPLTGVEDIKKELVVQLTSSVQWVKSVQFMVEQGVTRFVELGPKDVTAGLVRRIDKDVHAVSVGDVASIKAFSEG